MKHEDERRAMKLHSIPLSPRSKITKIETHDNRNGEKKIKKGKNGEVRGMRNTTQCIGEDKEEGKERRNNEHEERREK